MEIRISRFDIVMMASEAKRMKWQDDGRAIVTTCWCTHTLARTRARVYIFISRKTSRKIPSRNFWRGINGRSALLASNRAYSDERSTDKITFHSSWIISSNRTRANRFENPLKISYINREEVTSRNFTRVERFRENIAVPYVDALNATFSRYPLKYGVNY